MATLPRSTFAAGEAIIASDMNTNFQNVEILINQVLSGNEAFTGLQATNTASFAALSATGTVTAGAFSTTGTITAAGGFTGALTATPLTATGDANFDSGTLFVDASTNRVGIGDTTPGYTLDVAGEIRATGNIRGNQLLIGSTDDGLQSVSGDYGSVQTAGSGAGGYEGYSINGHAVFMSSGSDSGFGLYDDAYSNWAVLCDREGSTKLYYDGNLKLNTTSSGVTVTGTLTAGSFSGSGASLSNLNGSNISSGTVPTAQIPNLSANKITSDTLDVARIPDLNASKIDAGTFGAGNYTFPGGLNVNGLLNVSSQKKIEFGNGNDQIRFDDDINEYEFWADSNKMTRIGTSAILDTSGGTFVAKSPASASGTAAHWVLYQGYYFLWRNSSTAADKENISTDLGTHLTADMIDSVVPKMWNRITAPGVPEIGPIAEDVDALSPFLASHGTDANGDQVITGINNTAWMSLMTLAIKDLRDRMEAVEAA